VQKLAEIATHAEKALSVTLPTYTWPFSYKTDDYTYMCLNHEAIPTNYALVHEACTVQMDIPSIGGPQTTKVALVCLT